VRIPDNLRPFFAEEIPASPIKPQGAAELLRPDNVDLLALQVHLVALASSWVNSLKYRRWLS